MDLISNFAGTISASQFSEKSKSALSDIDFNDNTFGEILEKQMNNTIQDNKINIQENLGIPSGMNIAELEGLSPVLNTNPIQKIDNYNIRFQSDEKFSTSEILAFFPSLFDSKPTLAQNTTNGLFDFEKKLAANSYGKYSRSVVTDVSEFVTDALKLS